MKFRLDIQGLRAIAFLLVFIFHLNKDWLPGGFIGVDIFFVISGFLITTIVLNDIDKERFSFTSFYEKRLKRLFPAYFVMLIFVLLVGSYVYLFADLNNLRNWLLSSLIFVSNYYFGKGASYFGAQSSENPLLHTWSLAVEMQFYLFLPFLLFYMGRKKLIFLFSFLIIIISAATTYLLLSSDNVSSIYYSLLSRIPEFFIGCLCSLLQQKLNLKGILYRILNYISFLVIIIFSLFYKESYLFPGISALIPCLSVGFILLSRNEVFSINSLLSKKLIVYIGTLSYSLYLWHWPIMAFMRYFSVNYYFSSTEYILIIIFTFLFGFLSYNFIENRFKGKSNVNYLKYIVLSLMIFISVTLFIPKMLKYKELDKIYSQPYFGLDSDNKKYISKVGDLTRNDNILFFGDSNGLALKAFFDFIGKRNHLSFNTFSVSTYLPLSDLNPDEFKLDTINLDHSSTKKYLNRAIEFGKFIKPSIEKSDVIIVNCTDYNRIPSQLKSVIHLANNLKEGQKLVFFNTFPALDRNPIRINRGIKKSSNYDFKIKQKNIPKELLMISKTNKNVFIYDVNKSKILREVPYYKDTIIYYDQGHLNNYGARLLATDLEKDFINFYNSKVKN